jgi:hypothetical protein
MSATRKFWRDSIHNFKASESPAVFEMWRPKRLPYNKMPMSPRLLCRLGRGFFADFLFDFASPFA